MTSWLHRLASQDANYSFILLEDSLNHSGRHLLYALAELMVDRVDEIHIVAAEIQPDEVSSLLGPKANNKLIIHDYWTNPLGWNNSEGDTLRVTSNEDLLLRIRTMPRTSTPSKIAVIIDAISSLLRYQTDSIISTSLLSLLCAADDAPEIQSICVVGMLHSDLHTEKTINALRHLADIQIRLLPGRPTSTSLDGAFEIIVNQKNGKVKRQKEAYTVNDHLFVQSAVMYHVDQAVTDIQPDPTANLTFNLTLKDSERKAKENVVLPYTSRQDQSSDGAQSQIFYEPDEADDFDEEDPDDDLDI